MHENPCQYNEYADGTIAEGNVSILGYGSGLSHVVYPERVGDSLLIHQLSTYHVLMSRNQIPKRYRDNAYVTDFDKAYADVTVNLIYKVDSTLLEEANQIPKRYRIRNHRIITNRAYVILSGIIKRRSLHSWEMYRLVRI